MGGTQIGAGGASGVAGSDGVVDTCTSYNYINNNCHTSVNQVVINDPTEAIMRCTGGNSDQAGHTINWKITSGSQNGNFTVIQFSYENPGGGYESCQAIISPYIPESEWLTQQAATILANSTAQMTNCISQMCNGQQNNGPITFLPPGQLTEIPGYGACIRQTLGTNTQLTTTWSGNYTNQQITTMGNSCRACCTDRADRIDRWLTKDNKSTAEATNYLSQCITLCNGFFQPSKTGGEGGSGGSGGIGVGTSGTGGSGGPSMTGWGATGGSAGSNGSGSPVNQACPPGQTTDLTNNCSCTNNSQCASGYCDLSGTSGWYCEFPPNTGQ
jgi:hypothetical protein